MSTLEWLDRLARRVVALPFIVVGLACGAVVNLLLPSDDTWWAHLMGEED